MFGGSTTMEDLPSLYLTYSQPGSDLPARLDSTLTFFIGSSFLTASFGCSAWPTGRMSWTGRRETWPPSLPSSGLISHQFWSFRVNQIWYQIFKGTLHHYIHIDVTKRASEESRSKLSAKLAELPAGTIPEVLFHKRCFWYWTSFLSGGFASLREMLPHDIFVIRRSWLPTRRRPTGTSGWQSCSRNTVVRRSWLSCMLYLSPFQSYCNVCSILYSHNIESYKSITFSLQSQDIANASAWTHLSAPLSHLVFLLLLW